MAFFLILSLFIKNSFPEILLFLVIFTDYRKAKFYGHVRRHDSLQRVILEGKVEGKRGRGRKRTSWTDNSKTHLGLPINTCAELALDRKK